ncbi:MAG: hypothetical protein R8M37_03565 [Alphaproteobacteria bacterium]|nr:hypothetical protein [Alphaproteobacteria bacterium]
MQKIQEYNISASYLVPAYNLPKGVRTHYLTTVRGQHNNGTISIDVWLVNAIPGQEEKSITNALAQEFEEAKKQLQESKSQDKENGVECSPKTAKVDNAVKVFGKLVSENAQPVYHKKPDAEFLNIARKNLMYGVLKQYTPNMDAAVYLAGLSHYNER